MSLAENIVNRLSWIDGVVNYVWIFLGILMIVSLYLVYTKHGIMTREGWLIVGVMVATITYPLYTIGFQLVPGLIGNLVYLSFVIYVITQLFKAVPIASYMLLPITVWVTVASVYVVAQLLS